MGKHYDFTDKIIVHLRTVYIRKFRDFKALLSIDEINLLDATEKLYAELYGESKKALLVLAKRYYADTVTKGKKTEIDDGWIDAFLLAINPVVKYSWDKEVDRKRQYFFEGLVATENDPAEADKALRYFANMGSQYAIMVTDEAVMQAYKDDDVKFVRWVTQNDRRVCAVCDERHNKVYALKDVPDKEHIGCRCILVPVKIKKPKEKS